MLKDIKNLTILRLFRSREVKQSYITSIATTLMGFFHSLRVIAYNMPDLVKWKWLIACIDNNEWTRNISASLLCSFWIFKNIAMEAKGQNIIHWELLQSDVSITFWNSSLPYCIKVNTYLILILDLLFTGKNLNRNIQEQFYSKIGYCDSWINQDINKRKSIYW